jgi:hypothetical protein
MSSNRTTAVAASSAPVLRPVTPVRPLRFSTLVSVEARKLVDTRSGQGILAGVLTVVTALLAWKVGHGTVEVSFDNYAGAATTIVAYVAPIVGLLAMTSEWTQRTALTTFTLAPRRFPVMAAKLVAAVALSLVVLAVALLLAFGTTALGGAIHGGADFTGAAGQVRGFAVLVALQVLMACAIGALARQTLVAVVAFMAAPMAFAAVSDELLGGASPWFDVFDAHDRLSSTHPFAHGAQTLTAIALWVGLPCVLGVIRSIRSEVK